MKTFSQMHKEPAELDALVALAQREHHAGRLVEAAAAYRQDSCAAARHRRGAQQPGHRPRGLGKLGEAAAQYGQAIARQPDYAEAHNNLGIVSSSRASSNGEARHIEQDAGPPAGLRRSAQQPGQSCSEPGQARRSGGTLSSKRWLSGRTTPRRTTTWATSLRDQGKLDEAAARFQQALALRPDYAEAHNNLGNIRWEQGKLDEAAARYEQALALRPDYAEAHNNLGNVLAEQGKLDEAVARFEQALALRPDLCRGAQQPGQRPLEQGKLDEAAARYEQALALRPDYAEAHNNLGNVRWSRASSTRRRHGYEQALALRPDYAEAHNNLGNVLLDQGKLDEAAARYEQALALRPDYADAQLGLATCYLVEGDYERGWPAYEGRLRMRPGLSRSPAFRAGRANPWRDAACCCSPSKAWGIRSISSDMPGC